MSHYTIGELAKQSEVTIRTLQYYDRKGLLIANRQTDSNRRFYTDEHLKQLELILVLKQLGCTLDEIKILLDEDTNMKTLKTLLSIKKDDLHSKIEMNTHTLNKIKKVETYISEQSHSPIHHLTDIDHIMRQEHKMKHFRKKVWISAGILGIIQYSGILLSLMKNSMKPFVVLLPFLILYVMALTVLYFKKVLYLCPNCQHTFKPTLGAFVKAKHTPKTRQLTCPNCHQTHYCIEVYQNES
mgnify:CR=1 FL=1